MAVSKEDILSAVADMSVMDLVELIEAMEEKFAKENEALRAKCDELEAKLADATKKLEEAAPAE